MFKTIRNKFLLIYIALFTITIMVLSAMFIYASSSIINQMTSEQAMRDTRFFANEISEKLLYHRILLENMAIENVIQEFDEVAAEKVLNHFMLAEDILFENVFLTDMDGQTMSMTRSYDKVSERPYYINIVSGEYDYYIGDPIWGRVLEQPVVHISVAVKNKKDQLRAVLTGSIPLSRLSEEIEDTKLIGDSIGWIVNQEGVIIAHPNIAFDTYTNINDLPRNDDFYSQVNFQEILSTEEGTGYFIHPLDNVMRGYTYTEVEHSPGWRLGITFVERDIFSSRATLRGALITFASFILFIAIIITIILTSSVVKPIQLLTHATQEEKLFDDKLNRLQENKEMKTLISAYNNMHNRIKRHTEELEDLVEERTLELNLANEALYKQATEDRLTGVLNRRQLNTEVSRLMEKVQMGEMKTFGVLFMDLNNFKYYNDNFGHDVGDKILIDVVKRFNASINPEDIIIRYGGDEFIIILPNINDVTVKGVIERIKESIAKTDSYKEMISDWLKRERVLIPENKALGISIGYAIYYGHENQTLEGLLQKADQYMYDMKHKKS